MGGGARDGLAGIEALIREATAERARLVREGHPRGDPADPSCPLGCLDLWLAALRGHRAELRRHGGGPPGPGPR